LFEDHGSTRIDLACPHCRQTFKVRLRKLQFGADLVCRLCRHEFSARDVSVRAEVQEALARMHRIVEQRTQNARLYQPHGVGGGPRPLTPQSPDGQSSSDF
jgi:superfamily II helicase